ncbi:hypothetical protein BS50DRAFT_603952 [Corynespora cassiicola Philippines]|uniref:F-box domain-containing protein n=1 Tax=Corynespora cassiicola Philippines TaxID=1448308 RepID=A0A2T2N9C1_CORCC|nr:hypothetical protein BS50DRAFT_603952 [Corynespora cassiicola Philippines]
MAALSPSVSASSDSSRPASPALSDPSKRKQQDSAFLKLPVDIFKCVLDYLDRDEAWVLKRLCRGMSRSESVTELLYKYPIQVNDVRDIRIFDWEFRSMGRQRWTDFQDSINDSNRHYVQKLALSHWASTDDFKWIEENLPSLTSLDLSAIKDFVWTPMETWTWRMLADACPALFGRLEELEVSNWADYTAHSRIEYSYSYADYRFKQKFRLSRRRDGGSIAAMIFPICKKLKTLAIRERYSGFHTWNEWEVHQRVCCLVDGITKHCPPTMTRLKVHDYAPYRQLFSTDATTWSNITHVEIGLYSWMEDRRDRDVIGPIPYRITQGHHHRDEEEAFDDKTFDSCSRDHMALGNSVVQGVGASFEDLLQNLRTISQKYPHIKIKPLKNLEDIVLHPFHLVNVNQRRLAHHPSNQQLQAPPQDPVSSEATQDALRWLSTDCNWKPVLSWDCMMCDVFPANLEPNRTFLPKQDILSRIKIMVETLRSLNIPIRLSIGDRSNSCPTTGLDGSLYFGDYKCFIGEDDDRREHLAQTHARFNLSGIAHLVDELTIQYPQDVPGIGGWSRSKRPTEAEKALLQREKKGWRRFWARYALQFKNLKKLTTNVPNDIYDDWSHCGSLRELLSDSRWKMLEVEDKNHLAGLFNHIIPAFAFRYSFTRKRHRMRFVQRVFFREDRDPLPLALPYPELSDHERDEKEIPEEAIANNPNLPEHRFWMPRPDCPDRAGKRKATDATPAEDGNPAKKQKVE